MIDQTAPHSRLPAAGGPSSKAALFFFAFLPPENGHVSLQLLILGVLFVVMGLLGTIVVAVAGGVGGIYCALGIRLALQEK